MEVPAFRVLSRLLGGVQSMRERLGLLDPPTWRALTMLEDPLSDPLLATAIRLRLGWSARALSHAVRDEAALMRQHEDEEQVRRDGRHTRAERPEAVARLRADAEARPLRWRG